MAPVVTTASLLRPINSSEWQRVVEKAIHRKTSHKGTSSIVSSNWNIPNAVSIESMLIPMQTGNAI